MSSPLIVLIASLEPHHILHVLRVREHIHRLDFLHSVCDIQQIQIARLRGRIATNIHNPFRTCE